MQRYQEFLQREKATFHRRPFVERTKFLNPDYSPEGIAEL